MDDLHAELPERARRLLVEESRLPAVSGATRARLEARLGAAIAAGAALSIAATTASAGSAATGSVTTSSVTTGGVASDAAADAAADAAGTALTQGASILGVLGKSKLLLATIAFGLGSGAGATLHAVATHPAETPSAPAASLAAPLVSERAPLAATPALEAAVTPPASASAIAPALAPSNDPSTGPASALRRERALIDTARMAVLRGDGAAALDALRAHALAFPEGQHKAEREALEKRARALVAR